MIVFLIDADNLSSPDWVDEACKRLEAEEGSIAVRRAYGSADNLRGLSEVMHAWAIRPFLNLALSKNTTDVALAVDAMELACMTPRPTLMAIGSGDADFLPLVVRLRERGIRMVCVSERSKMAQEAAHAYDHVLHVGPDNARGRRSQADKPPAITAVDSGTTPATKAQPRRSPARKAAAEPVPAKLPAARKAAARKPAASVAAVTVAQILHAAPALKDGEPQPLGEIARLLHDAKLLGRNASSTKLFNKHAQEFELAPARQPNAVRYLGTRRV